VKVIDLRSSASRHPEVLYSIEFFGDPDKFDKNDPEDKKPSFDDIRTVTHLKERADEIVKTKQTEFIKFLEEWR
jgi:hypothetical protein